LLASSTTGGSWLIKKGNYAPAFDTIVLTIHVLAHIVYAAISEAESQPLLSNPPRRIQSFQTDPQHLTNLYPA
jgi:hypothetical protein